MCVPSFTKWDVFWLLLIPCAVVVAAAIGLEHLAIWIWHHISISYHK